jgi:rhodanese-related sulfurtransferase
MSVFLTCCFLGIFLILIWCSLQGPEGRCPSRTQQDNPKDRLEYILISPALLAEWAVRDERLMIIDLRPSTHAETDFDRIPGSLRISPRELRSYFCYLPPHTRLALYDETAVTSLDSKAEDVLLTIGIPAVYVLEANKCARHAYAKGKTGVIELLPEQ